MPSWLMNCTINSHHTVAFTIHLWLPFILSPSLSDSPCLSFSIPFKQFKKEQKNNVCKVTVCICWQDVGKLTRRRISCLFCCTETHSHTARKKVERNLCVENKHLSDCWHCDSWKGGGGGKNERQRKREWEMDTAKSALGVTVLAAHLLIDLSIDPAFCLWVFSLNGFKQHADHVLPLSLLSLSPLISPLSLSIHLSIPLSTLPHSLWMLCDALQSHTINGRGSWKMIFTYLGDITVVVMAYTLS